MTPVNATISDALGVGTIIDNDLAPTIASVTSPTVVEGNDLIYTVNLTNGFEHPDQLRLHPGRRHRERDGLRQPSFSNGVTLVGGNLIIPAGVTSFTVTLPTVNDTLNEVSETVPLVIGGVTGTGTITDNDQCPACRSTTSAWNEAAGTTLHRDPVGGFRADRDGRLQHQQRHGDGGERLHQHQRHADVRPRHHDADDHRTDHQRHPVPKATGPST